MWIICGFILSSQYLDINAANLPTATFCAFIIYQSFLISFFNKRCHYNGDKYKECLLKSIYLALKKYKFIALKTNKTLVI